VLAFGLAFLFLASRMTTRERGAGSESGFIRRTGLLASVLDFVLVWGSEGWAFETHLENAKNRTNSLKSIVCMVWQVMTSNGQKWLKVDF
jgi:hypothetical protein